MVGDSGHQEPVRQLVVVPDPDLDDEVRHASRALVFEAFGDRFTRDDWDHAAGGWRAVLLDGSMVVAHAAVVPRQLTVGRSVVAAGYVEAVATRRELQGTGAGSAVMAAVAGVIGSEFEMGALSTSRTSFYARLGWESLAGTVVRAQRQRGAAHRRGGRGVDGAALRRAARRRPRGVDHLRQPSR